MQKNPKISRIYFLIKLKISKYLVIFDETTA